MMGQFQSSLLILIRSLGFQRDSQVVTQALSAGHEVIAIAQHPEHVTARPNLIVRAGEVLDAASLQDSCNGADAVISCIVPRTGAGTSRIMNNLRPSTTMSIGTANMVAAAEAAGVGRFVFQSGIGLSDGSEMTYFDRWILRLLWRPIFGGAIRDKAEGELILRASKLEWVIVRPVGLKDADAATTYLAGPNKRVALFSALSYTDCAASLLRSVTESKWTRQIINVGP